MHVWYRLYLIWLKIEEPGNPLVTVDTTIYWMVTTESSPRWVGWRARWIPTLPQALVMTSDQVLDHSWVKPQLPKVSDLETEESSSQCLLRGKTRRYESGAPSCHKLDASLQKEDTNVSRKRREDCSVFSTPSPQPPRTHCSSHDFPGALLKEQKSKQKTPPIPPSCVIDCLAPWVIRFQVEDEQPLNYHA